MFLLIREIASLYIAHVTAHSVGDPKGVRALHKVLKYIDRRKTTIVRNGFGKWWLENLVTKRGKEFIATVTVRNTGNMAGRQVVQLYVNSPTTTHETPVRELKAFAKTELLQPGQSQKLTMDFSNYDLATFYHEDSAWKTIAGTYIVEICEDAETIKISMPLRIKDTTKYAVNNVLNN